MTDEWADVIPAPWSELVRVRGVDLAVHRWGNSKAPAVLYLHALLPAASGFYAQALAEKLCGNQMLQLVAPDMPGFGRSPARPAGVYEMDHLVEVVSSCLDSLALERVAVIGHSWGAALACHLVAERPSDFRALILLDGGHFDHVDLDDVDPNQTVAEIAAEAARDGWQVSEPNMSDFLHKEQSQRRSWDRITEMILRRGVRERPNSGVVGICTNEVAASVMHAMVHKRSSESYSSLRQDAVPCLLLYATEPDERRVMNADRVRKFQMEMPHAEIVAVEGAGHDVVLDAGPRLGDAIERWLRQHP